MDTFIFRLSSTLEVNHESYSEVNLDSAIKGNESMYELT